MQAAAMLGAARRVGSKTRRGERPAARWLDAGTIWLPKLLHRLE
jgi:hypothetical protein